MYPVVLNKLTSTNTQNMSLICDSMIYSVRIIIALIHKIIITTKNLLTFWVSDPEKHGLIKHKWFQFPPEFERSIIRTVTLLFFTYEILKANNCFRLFMKPLKSLRYNFRYPIFKLAEHKMAPLQVYFANLFSYSTSRSILNWSHLYR